MIPSRKASYGASGHSEINGVSVFVPESSSRAAIDGALGNHGKVRDKLISRDISGINCLSPISALRFHSHFSIIEVFLLLD